jgi:Spy/CpxP family protein refolding chaperone
MLRFAAPFAALLVAAPLVATPGGAGWSSGLHGRRGDPAERFARRAERVADLLELDAAQRAAFEQMLDARLDATRPKLDAMRALGDELRALLESGSTDAAAIGEKTLALHRLRGELHAEREAARAEFVALLSDEQRFAFEALEESREMRRGRHGRHRGPGFGPAPERD